MSEKGSCFRAEELAIHRPKPHPHSQTIVVPPICVQRAALLQRLSRGTALLVPRHALPVLQSETSESDFPLPLHTSVSQ